MIATCAVQGCNHDGKSNSWRLHIKAAAACFHAAAITRSCRAASGCGVAALTALRSAQQAQHLCRTGSLVGLGRYAPLNQAHHILQTEQQGGTYARKQSQQSAPRAGMPLPRTQQPGGCGAEAAARCRPQQRALTSGQSRGARGSAHSPRLLSRRRLASTTSSMPRAYMSAARVQGDPSSCSGAEALGGRACGGRADVAAVDDARLHTSCATWQPRRTCLWRGSPAYRRVKPAARLVLPRTLAIPRSAMKPRRSCDSRMLLQGRRQAGKFQGVECREAGREGSSAVQQRPRSPAAGGRRQAAGMPGAARVQPRAVPGRRMARLVESAHPGFRSPCSTPRPCRKARASAMSWATCHPLQQAGEGGTIEPCTAAVSAGRAPVSSGLLDVRLPDDPAARNTALRSCLAPPALPPAQRLAWPPSAAPPGPSRTAGPRPGCPPP